MSDPRNALFSEIHGVWLKPMGFRKAGRRGTKTLADGTELTIQMESYPAAPGGPIRFSLEIRANLVRPDPDSVTYCMHLPSYADKQQYWTIHDDTDATDIKQRAMQSFESLAVPALHKMHTLEGLLQLFREVPSHVPIFWYYESYLHLLKLLGRHEDGTALLQRTIEASPHDRVKQRAAALLAQHEAANNGDA